jgi:hypothetical protein
MKLRVCCLTLLAASGIASLALAAEAEPLPAPPKPPRSARLQPPPEPIPSPAPAPSAAIPSAAIPSAAMPSAPVEGLAYGSIVSSPVALYPHVRVKDGDDVAPGAVPVVVAVRDPNPCRREPAGLVFVQVCVPTCPLCKLRVNRWGTEVKLDYGKYEVKIRSHAGTVTVNYND